jgi:hypothetical protein
MNGQQYLMDKQRLDRDKIVFLIRGGGHRENALPSKNTI